MREVGRGIKKFSAAPVRGVWRPMDSVEDVLSFMDDEPADSIVLVADAGATFLAPIFEDLVAVVCRSGTEESHIAIVSRDYSVPCVMGTTFTEEPEHGAIVEVDCSGDEGVVRIS